ncbi:MAG: spermidine synthase [Gammaproteobacteria bacterium]
MAVLWQKRIDGVRYDVRSAGNTVRLYTNGVLHTQYNPQRLATGSVWDLLTIGALLLPPASVRRVLVLGVGGGTAIRQLLEFFPQARVTGIELNPVHLQLAKRFFALDDPRVELVCADAIAWLAMHDGEPFDLIIDDLFGERDGVPCRAVRADADWLDLLVSQLEPCGMLTMNFPDRREATRAPWREVFVGRRGRPRFPLVLSLATPTCENRVLSFVPRAGSVAGLRRAVVARDFAARYSARALAPGKDAG